MTTLKLYYSPLACSLSCHIALEESGLPYGTEEISTKAQANLTPSYRTINPLGKVPALAIDGQILTEAAAIMSYVADLVPAKNLLPPAGTRSRAFAHEWLNFLSSAVHVAFRPVLRPERMVEDAGCIDGLRRVGIAAVIDVLTYADSKLGRGPYALGETFSLCDGYLLVFYLWSRREQFKSQLPPFPALQAMARLVLARPSVQAVLKAEGLAIPSV
jgi:glutathione S-transferase